MTATAPVHPYTTRRRGTIRELLQEAVAYAVLAPSSHNTQPWRFQINGNALLLFADRSRGMPVADPRHRELVMSCGAALFNLRTALQHWGLAVRAELLPDPTQPDLLARVTIAQGRPGTEEHRALVAAMGRRRTHRESFADVPLPDWLLQSLTLEAEREGAWLAVVSGADRLRAAELVRRGSRQQFGSSAHRRELASWMRPNWTRRPDGMPGYAFGFGWLKAAVSRFILGLFDIGKAQARHEQELALHAPALVVLGTAGDTPREWLAAGQALQRMLLTAAAHGVSASFLNAAVQVTAMRRQLLLVTARHGEPQVFLRLGFGAEARATPRRLPTEVLREVP